MAMLIGCVSASKPQVRQAIAYEADENRFLVMFGPDYRASDFHIVDSKSVIVAPEGTRYGVRSEDVEEDLDPEMVGLSRYLYFAQPPGGRVEDGTWHLAVVIQGPSGEERRNLELSIPAELSPHNDPAVRRRTFNAAKPLGSHR